MYLGNSSFVQELLQWKYCKDYWHAMEILVAGNSYFTYFGVEKEIRLKVISKEELNRLGWLIFIYL